MNNYKLCLLLIVLYYFSLNLYIFNSKSIFNMMLFLILFFIFNLIMEDKINAIVLSYVLCVFYNIKMKFHLMENYNNGNNGNTKNNNNNKNNNKIDAYENVLDALSERLITKYVNKKKIDKPELITAKKIKTTDLQPVKSELCNKKIKKMMNKKKLLRTPIIVTKDNFICDGHHRWYIHKNNDKKFVNVIVIEMNIEKFFKDIQKFKKEYNRDQVDKVEIDKDKLDKAKQAIDIILEYTKQLKDQHKELNKINVV